MKELKQLNDKLFYSLKIRKDKYKNHVSATIVIASATSFTGFLYLKLTRQYKFGKSIKYSSLEEKFKDRYFLKIVDDIFQIKEIEDLVLYLISIGFYDIIKKIDFLNEMSLKYKLLRE